MESRQILIGPGWPIKCGGLRIFRLKFISRHKDTTMRGISKENAESTKYNRLTTRKLKRINAWTILAIIWRFYSIKPNLYQPISFWPHNITAPAPYLLAEQRHRILEELGPCGQLIKWLGCRRHLNHSHEAELLQHSLPTTMTLRIAATSHHSN